jgi:hypothetical protein
MRFVRFEVGDAGPHQLPLDRPLVAGHRFVTAVLERQAEAMRAEHDPPATGLEFVACGLFFPLFRSALGLGAPGSARDAVVSRSLWLRPPPPLTGLFSALPVPQSTELYALHGLFLDQFLAALQESHRDGLKTLFVMLARGRPVDESIAFVIGMRAGVEDGVDAWFADSVHRRAEKAPWFFRPSDVEHRLAGLAEVRLVVPGRVGAGTVTLRGLPDVLRSDSERSAVASRMLDELNAILKRTPPLLREAVLGYGEALTALEAGRGAAFRRRLEVAEREFADAMARSRAVSALLDEAEAREDGTATEPAALLHGVASRYAASLRELDPELHAYLDRLEFGQRDGDWLGP